MTAAVTVLSSLAYIPVALLVPTVTRAATLALLAVLLLVAVLHRRRHG